MSVYAFRRRKRLPEPVPWLRTAIVVTLLILTGGCGVSLARADELDAAALAVWATPTPAPEPTRYVPAARGGRPAVARWADAVAAYDWDVDQALRVIECESKGDPTAVNPASGAAGLFQLYGWSWLARRLFGSGDVTIPWINIAVAHELWAESGGTFRWHWAASWGCWL